MSDECRVMHKRLLDPRPGAGGAELLAAKLSLANWGASAIHA
jgi:hypothetical protein